LIFDEVKGGFFSDGIADCHVWRRLWKEMGRFWGLSRHLRSVLTEPIGLLRGILSRTPGVQLLPEAGAQRTLEVVSCTPWLEPLHFGRLNRSTQDWHSRVPQGRVSLGPGRVECTNVMWTDLVEKFLEQNRVPLERRARSHTILVLRYFNTRPPRANSLKMSLTIVR
jgi:hypothetical protein